MVGESEPSRFIRQIIHEMPYKSNNVNIIDTIYKNPDIKVDNATTFEISKTEEIIAKIKKRFYGENEVGRKFGLSPTAISMYFKCPMMFYLNCIENINEDTHEELIQSNEIGNIIHSFFQLQIFTIRFIEILLFAFKLFRCARSHINTR